jgi:hypothetical protein
MAWSEKSKYFTAAACMILVVSLLSLARTNLDRINYNSSENVRLRREVQNVIDSANEANRKLQAQKGRAGGSAATIEKELVPFKYRDVVPLLHQTIISVLPNEKNNPKQKELYRAFADGDVKGVVAIPRKERKQIFLTNISAYFTEDLETSQFGAKQVMGRSRKRTTTSMPGMSMPGIMMPGMMMPGSGAARSEVVQTHARQRAKDTAAGMVGEKAGFVVTIAGYSPYEDIQELMDPAGAGEDKSKWGVITRLMHLDELDEVFDGNSPFELYKRLEVEHCKLEIGKVDLDAEMPPGIGFVEVRPGKVKVARAGRSTEQVLIDPMTKEVINKVIELDENGREKQDRYSNAVYKTNDHWFRLDVKFVWKEVLKQAEDSG